MQNIKNYLANKLNEEQLKAALHTNSSSLILAGAGSGKTRTLTYKIWYIIFGLKIDPSNILAVTFTNKAANEMKERLMEISDDFSQMISDDWQIMESKMLKSSESLENRQKSFNWIGTFHSVFLKILKEDIDKLGRKYNKNFTIIDSDDSNKIVNDILKNRWLHEAFNKKEIKGFISRQKNNGFDTKMFVSKATNDYENNMAKIYVDYQKELEKSNLLDFDDLLLLPYLLFKKDPEVLEKWKRQFLYIMVDEAQDTNWIQFELMKMLSGSDGNITLIGDDYQSIYGWRWALMDNFLNVKQYWTDIQMFKLQINYRSRPHIVNAGNCVIKNNLKQYQKDVRSYREEGGKITVFSHSKETDEAGNIIHFVSGMIDKWKIKWWNEVAILYRTNAQSAPFEGILVSEKIPYKIYGAYKFFERKEVKDILAYMKYLANPWDSMSLKRILNIPNRKIGKTSLEKIEEYAFNNELTLHEVLENIEIIPVNIKKWVKDGIIDFKTVIHEITDHWDDYNTMWAMEKIVKSIKYKEYLSNEFWDEEEEKIQERFENIWQLVNMTSKYEEKWQDGVKTFVEELTLMTDVIDDDSNNVNKLKLMTAHTSKGLEFPWVFLVGLEDNIFPLSNAILEPHLLEEERRLMYVAVTRAKDHLFLSYTNSRRTWWKPNPNPPSRFISEIPDELLKFYHLWSNTYEHAKKIDNRNDFYRKTTLNYNDSASAKFDEWDIVFHKMFGRWEILEIWDELAVVKLENTRFGTQKIETRFLTLVW